MTMNLWNTFLELFQTLSVIQTMVISTVVLTAVYYIVKIREMPPGPWGIPFIGYWPFLRTHSIHLQMQEMKDKYGDIFSITVTGNLFIVLNTIKSIKEAHIANSECFGDRFTGYSIMEKSFEDSVSMINGESWQTQRRFYSQKFKEFGMMAVKEEKSSAIYDVLKDTVEEIHAMEGQPIAISDLLTSKCSAIIRRIMFNDQGITEEELKALNSDYFAVLDCMTDKNLLLIGNFARFGIFPFMPSYRAMIRSHNRIQRVLENIVARHKIAFDENQVLDIIDSYYKAKQDKERQGDPSAKYFTDKALKSSLYQFLTDGVLTVAYFISTIIQILIIRPEEQEKIYEELCDVIGPNRQPTIEDKSKLSYTNAFLYEAVRYSDFFAMHPSTKCVQETSIDGYKIPKGAVTVLNTWSAHHDPKVFENPFKFDPSRYLAKPGKQRPDLPVMFGIGKRSCMGEPFTMLQTFLFLATILKKFSLAPCEYGAVSNLTSTENLKIYAHPRNEEPN